MSRSLFHLAFPVYDLAATKQFYVEGLGCTLGRESASAFARSRRSRFTPASIWCSSPTVRSSHGLDATSTQDAVSAACISGERPKLSSSAGRPRFRLGRVAMYKPGGTSSACAAASASAAADAAALTGPSAGPNAVEAAPPAPCGPSAGPRPASDPLPWSRACTAMGAASATLALTCSSCCDSCAWSVPWAGPVLHLIRWRPAAANR